MGAFLCLAGSQKAAERCITFNLHYFEEWSVPLNRLMLR